MNDKKREENVNLNLSQTLVDSEGNNEGLSLKQCADVLDELLGRYQEFDKRQKTNLKRRIKSL